MAIELGEPLLVGLPRSPAQRSIAVIAVGWKIVHLHAALPGDVVAKRFRLALEKGNQPIVLGH